jgi:predicted phage terminase large subunit-like protein
MRTADHLRRHVALQDALLTRQAERSLRAYIEQAWPILEPTTPFLENWHIDLIVEHLEAITAGQITRLLINVPPRYMKSLLVSVLWPTWEWIRYPSRRWIFTSYSEALSLKHSLDRRTLLQSDWYQARWGTTVQLAADQNVKGEFANTARGTMIATSIGGSITGKGGDRIVIDDPHHPMQAESDAQREAALEYFRLTLSTRLDDRKRGAMVVIMQRLHERDLSARFQELEPVAVCLPAEAETPTQIVFPRSGRIVTRDTGDVLWPEREDRAELAQQRRLLGSAAFAAQYQQRPAPAGGLIFQRDWFQYYDELPSGLEIAQSWDMAFKDNKDSDYVVGLVAGRRGADIYLIDRVKGQWAFSESCRQVEALTRRYPHTGAILIEDAANGPAIIDALTHRIPGIIAVSPEGGKLARAQAAQPRVEAGNVYLPHPRAYGTLIPERAWVEDLVHHLAVFPHGAHDDDVDAFTQLLVRWQRPATVEWCTW